jgi:hypothetical protein
MSFEPEIDEDLFETKCECKTACLCGEYDDHALDEEELDLNNLLDDDDTDDDEWEDI